MRKLLVPLLFSSLVLFSCSSNSNHNSNKTIYHLEKKGERIEMTQEENVFRVLEFPKTRQAANWTCGANAVQKVCAYYGDDYREMDLVKLLHSSPEYGTALQMIMDFFKKHHYKAELKEYMTIEDLKKYTDRGIPVILMIQAWAHHEADLKGWDNGHFTVCIGYTTDDLIFADPSLYGLGFIPKNKLMERWHDTDVDDKKYYQTGIAVYGKKPKFDLQKIEEIY
ncbi:MAG: C39 family peptidase [Syntrophothermus sp.]